jgi:ABC-type multidrug transport system fused ATPase/permease subunit
MSEDSTNAGDTRHQDKLLPIADVASTRAKLIQAMQTHGGELFALIALHVLSIGASVSSPALFGLLVDNLNGQAPYWASSIFSVFGLLAIALVLKTVLTWLSQRASWKFGENVFMQLRNEVVGGMMRLPLMRIERAGRGDVVARVTSDINAVSEAVRIGLPESLVAVLYLSFTTMSSFFLDWRIAIVSVLGLPLLFISTRWYVSRSQHAYEEELKSHGRFDAVSSEAIESCRTVDLFAEEHQVFALLSAGANAVGNAEQHTLSLQKRWFPLVQFSYYLPFALIALVGGIFAVQGQANIGTVVAIAMNAQLVVDPLDDLVYWTDQMQLAWSALRRMTGVMDAPECITAIQSRHGHRNDYSDHTADNVICRTKKGNAISTYPQGVEIDAREVCVEYQPGEHALNNVNLHIDAGNHIAFVGPSGAGKTTLALVLCGLIPCTYGHVEFNVRAVSGDDDHPLIATNPKTIFIPQDGHLLSGSLRFNLQLADEDATDDDIREALQLVGASDLIHMLDDSLDAPNPVVEQRIALARVILAKPNLVVLDEATSALSVEESISIEHAIMDALEGTTFITIAHRLRTAMNADTIFVLDDHHIVEQGAPKTLIAAKGQFAHLCQAAQS